MSSLESRTDNACDQLTRYGGAVATEELAQLLEKLTDLNDNICNMRSLEVIKNNIAHMQFLLTCIESDEIKKETKWETKNHCLHKEVVYAESNGVATLRCLDCKHVWQEQQR